MYPEKTGTVITSPRVKLGGQPRNPGNDQGRELWVTGKHRYSWYRSQGESTRVVPKFYFLLSFIKIGSDWE